MKKVILITGASSGIGQQATHLLASRGNIVYGAARRVERINPAEAYPLKVDVTDEDSIKAAVDTIIEREGRIDVLVNNAGYGSYGAIEDVSLDEARNQFEVNVFGLIAVTKAVLPQMRAQGSGQIINISSVAGRTTAYFGGWYHASKYALESLSDALRMELKPFNIDVTIVEPGGIKTNWGKITADHLAKSALGGAYEAAAEKAAQSLRRLYGSNWLTKPVKIAQTITQAIDSRHPRTRYLRGIGAKPLVFAHTVLPNRVYDWIAMHMG